MQRPNDPGTRSYSFKILEEARRSKRGYNSQATREALTNVVKAVFNQNTPHDFQLDVAEAIILGLDATVIAGTGSGKTLPWVMPLLLDENRERACLVISPLKALQVDHVSCPSWKSTEWLNTTQRVHHPQAQFFSKLGIPAAAVNNDTWSNLEIKHVSELLSPSVAPLIIGLYRM